MSFHAETANGKQDGQFDPALWRIQRDSGPDNDCPIELPLNNDPFDGDRIDGTIVEKETNGTFIAGHADKRFVVVVDLAEVSESLAAGQRDEAGHCTGHTLDSHTFDVEVVKENKKFSQMAGRFWRCSGTRNCKYWIQDDSSINSKRIR